MLQQKTSFALKISPFAQDGTALVLYRAIRACMAK